MPVQINLTLKQGAAWLRLVDVRHELLRRVQRVRQRQDVGWLAWGLGDHCLRLVMDDAEGGCLGRMVRGLKVGTVHQARQQGVEVRFYAWDHAPVAEADLVRAVAWAHRADGAPLDSPWSSHRDMLGLRRTDYFDPAPLLARVRPLDVHRAAEGGPLPRRGYTRARDLGELLEVTAGVQGRSPGDPAAFGLFVSMGRAQGWGTQALARALDLTPRRVRQLAHAPQAEFLPLAHMALSDPRLRRVR